MKTLIVLSADALVEEDMENLSAMPNFRKYLAGGCGVKKIRSVYPTITYPCHTTMITGVYPDKHRICGNLEFHPGQTENLPWLWDRSHNKWQQDLFTEAKKRGYHTASVFWPVTGNHPAIDDLIDEYWVQSSDDTPEAAFARMGSDQRMIEIIMKNAGNTKRFLHPKLDQFIVDCACDILRQYKPDILFLHPADVDWARHQYGVFNDQVLRTIENTDRYIGMLMEAAKEAGRGEINFVLTSDHGQRNISKVVNPNVYLQEKGLIRLDLNGKMKEWDAWCLSGGMSANIYLKNPDQKEQIKNIYHCLQELKEQKDSGIERIFTKEEVKEQEHLEGDFSFILEAKEGYSFGDKVDPPYETKLEPTDYRYGRATHGYLPQKGPQPTFWAKGPDFRENVILEEGNLVDEAPTLAALLGIDLPGTDGRVMRELLR